MRGFELDVDFVEEDVISGQGRQPAARAVVNIATVAHKVTVTHQGPEARKDYLTKAPEDWDWSAVRNYVIAKIEERDRALGIPIAERQEGKEFGIFSAFWGRHEHLSGPIAVFAFETLAKPGYWCNAPIGIGRFTKKSDPFFADKIKARLTQA